MEIILPVIGVSFAAWCVWAVVRVVNDPQHWRTYFEPIGLAAGLVLIGALLLPAGGRGSRTASRRSQCTKITSSKIGLALHTYYDTYNSFPPAYIADTNGRPMHSWRVLLLPYLDNAPLYAKYRFSEPWDGPNNRKLADKILPVFNCPSEVHGDGKSASTMTSYVAVVGPETAWPGGSSMTIRDIKDGTSTTLLVVEVANSGIYWMEPRDLHVVQMAPTINAKAGQGISSPHIGGAQVLMGDGAVRFVSDQTTAELIHGLLTINGKETIGDF